MDLWIEDRLVVEVVTPDLAPAFDQAASAFAPPAPLPPAVDVAGGRVRHPADRLHRRRASGHPGELSRRLLAARPNRPRPA